MTEYETKVLELLDEISDSLGDIKFNLESLATTARDMLHNQAFPGSYKRKCLERWAKDDALMKQINEERKANGQPPIKPIGD